MLAARDDRRQFLSFPPRGSFQLFLAVIDWDIPLDIYVMDCSRNSVGGR